MPLISPPPLIAAIRYAGRNLHNALLSARCLFSANLTHQSVAALDVQNNVAICSNTDSLI